MQSNGRTSISVVGTLVMVLLTVALASWTPPATETVPAANQTSIIGEVRP